MRSALWPGPRSSSTPGGWTSVWPACKSASPYHRGWALQVPNRGYYFAYDQMDKRYEKHMTPATPAISLIQALNKQMDDMLAEGLDNRWKRHKEMAAVVQDWARRYFALYSDERYLSPTVTNVENTRGISVAGLNDELRKRGAMISNGYGDLKEKCFRIAHMGDLTLDDINWLLAQINDILHLTEVNR